MSSRPISNTSVSSSSTKKIPDDQKVVVLTQDDREWLCEEIRALKEENEKLRSMVHGIKVAIPTSPTPSATDFLASSPRSSTSSPPSGPAAYSPMSIGSALGSPNAETSNTGSKPNAASKSDGVDRPVAAAASAVPTEKKSHYRVSGMIADHFPEVMRLPEGHSPAVMPFEPKPDGAMPSMAATMVTPENRVSVEEVKAERNREIENWVNSAQS